MDNHIFRSALSGFNRQDVMAYIERTQKQAEEAAAGPDGKVCPVCGKISDTKFCPHCGAPMGE